MKMNDQIFFIKELKHYSRSYLLDIFDENTFNKLLKLSFLKIEEDSYKFNYVGVIIVDDIVINLYPKYIPGQDNIENDFKEVINVIKKYQSESEIDWQNDEIEDISFNLLSMMIFFLEDYYEYGIYNNVQNILEINGNGEIDWNRTINYTDPIIKDNKPYYADLYTKYKINDLFDYFRLLHEYSITDCSKRLEKAGLLELFDLTPVELSDKNHDDFGEISVILEKLEKELHVEFNTHKQKLLHSMHAYLKEDNSFSNENYLTVYGTSSYHVIWEKMCKKVFCDKLDKSLSQLGLDDIHTKLIEVIEKPVWYFEDKYPNEADKTFIPDIVTFWKDNFVILDAKYYNLKFGKNQLDGQPGLESITKQYLYELAFRDFIKKHEFKSVKNAFLFPTYGEDIENKGHVRLKILSDLGLEDIQVIMLPAKMINQLYLENKKMDIKNLNLY